MFTFAFFAFVSYRKIVGGTGRIIYTYFLNRLIFVVEAAG